MSGCVPYTNGPVIDVTIVEDAAGTAGEGLTQNFKDIANNVGLVIASSGDTSAGNLDSKIADGNGLTKSATSTLTLDVGAGSGITVNPDDVAVAVEPNVMEMGGTGLMLGTDAIANGGMVSGGAITLGEGSGIKIDTTTIAVNPIDDPGALTGGVSSTPTQAEVLGIYNKLNELMANMRAAGHM